MSSTALLPLIIALGIGWYLGFHAPSGTFMVNVHSFPGDFSDPAARRFAEAVADGRIKAALAAAANCPDGVNTVGDRGVTGLLMAVQRRNRVMAAALLKAGASPDGGPDYAPLHSAVKNDDLPMIRLLLDAHADPEKTSGHETALNEAAITGSVPAIQLLVSAGALVDKPDEIGQTNAMNAAAADNWNAVAFLLDHGASAWTEANGLTIAAFASDTRLLPNNPDGLALPGVIARIKASGFPWPPPSVAELRAMKAAGQWPPAHK